MEIRDRILRAAARVYSQHGFRGATTRLIAQEADVNEVTLFRTFGSKEALIEEAIRASAAAADVAELPDEPVDPEQELATWCASRIREMHLGRALIISCMADVEQRPEVACGANLGASRSWTQLKRYLERLRAKGLMDPNVHLEAAGSMFMGVAFGDAMGRPMIPELFPKAVEAAALDYTRLFLRAIAPGSGNQKKSGNGRQSAAGISTSTSSPK